MTQLRAVKLGKPFVEAAQFALPFSFGHERPRTDDEHGLNIASSLKLAQDEACLDGLAHAHTVGDQQARAVGPNETQHGPELVGDEVHPRGVERR